MVVTATSPNLQGEQIVVTDASGDVPHSPAAPRRLHPALREGGLPALLARRTSPCASTAPSALNVELLPESFQSDDGDRPAPRPTIDVGSTPHRRERGSGLLRAQPRGGPPRRQGRRGALLREPGGAGPGRQTRTPTASPSTAPPRRRTATWWTACPPTTPPSASSARPLSVEFVQEVNVITGGYLPEFGRSTGGVINAVTKSGSNEFHGSVFGNLTPGAFEGSPHRGPREGTRHHRPPAAVEPGRLRRRPGRPHPQGQAVVLRGRRALLHPLQLTAQPQRASCSTRTARPSGTSSGFSRTETPSPAPSAPTSPTSAAFQYIGKLTYLINAGPQRLAVASPARPSSSGGNGPAVASIRAPARLPGARNGASWLHRPDRRRSRAPRRSA